MESMTIGKVAKQAEVGVETIRFYERKGLIEDPPRGASGYRQYPSCTVDRLRFIKRAKELGFTLKQIRELLDLQLDPDTTCQHIRAHAECHIQKIEEKIRSLQRMKQALGKLTRACRGEGSVRACPILDALEAKV